MAKNQSDKANPEPRSDVERVLMFEWAADHYADLDRWLPKVDPTITIGEFLPPDQFHAITMRLAVMRKFAAPGDTVQLPKVWASMLALLPETGNDEPFRSSLAQHIDQWPKQLDLGGMRFKDGPESREQWLKTFNYGLVLHTDRDKMETLQRWDSVSHVAAWVMYNRPLGLHRMVRGTLENVRDLRASNSFDPPLPPPFERAWRDPEPFASADNAGTDD